MTLKENILLWIFRLVIATMGITSIIVTIQYVKQNNDRYYEFQRLAKTSNISGDFNEALHYQGGLK